MSDEQMSTSAALVPADGGVLSVLATGVLLAVSAAALYRAFRAAFHGCVATAAACRRWAIVASAAALAWFSLPLGVHVEPEVPSLLTVAALDCWLLVWNGPRDAIPRAIARRRSAPV